MSELDWLWIEFLEDNWLGIWFDESKCEDNSDYKNGLSKFTQTYECNYKQIWTIVTTNAKT